VKLMDSTRAWMMRRATASKNKETFHLLWSGIRSTVKQTWQQEWNAVSHMRLFTAMAASLVFFSSASALALHHVGQTSAWNRVYANGTYVGMVPNDQSVLGAMERLASGYNIKVQFSSIHTTVSNHYDWQSLTSLPTPAVAIELNGKPLVYTTNQQAAETVLSTVETAFTPKSLHSGHVHFAGHITVQPMIVSVANILTPSDAARFLMNPHRAAEAARAGSVTNLSDTTTSSAAQSISYLTNQTAPLLQVVATETLQKQSTLNFSIQYIADRSMGTGTTSVVTPGRKGQALDTVQYEYINGKLVQTRVLSHQIVRKPEAEVAKRGTNDGVAGGNWQWPVSYTDVTSPFGHRYLLGVYNFHPGVDIGCPVGTPIYATNNGVIEEAGWNSGGYGIWVKMSNGNGIESIYGHMSKVAVSSGQTVSKGQLLGYSGMTGFATGPHLHYEIRLDGTAINPDPYM